MKIDFNFDVRTDANGKDPDIYSNTLKKYHKFLWSKELPNGQLLDLEEIPPYLAFRFNMQTINFSSDSIANSYGNTKRINHLINEIDRSEIEEFIDKNSTIGAYIIFPSKRENGQMTINGARGFNNRIADRFDLTLECIRRKYLGLDNPLSETLNSATNHFFFSMFKDFRGYVDFFHLQDLASDDYQKVKFFIESGSDLSGNAVPRTAIEYREYKSNSMAFVDARAARMKDWEASRN